MIKFGKVLSRFNNNKFQGAYIGKIEYEIYYEYKGGDEEYISKIEKKNKFLTIISIDKKLNNRILENLKVYLVKINNAKSNKNKVSDEKLENEKIRFDSCKIIKKEEVYDFSKITGDKNYIHLTERPIVQGMLILDKIKKEIKNFRKLEIKFINPIFTDEKVFLKREENSILSYSNNRKCFKIIFK